jgi:HPt (histidine-containing phosphotransfer) domain-containing protein
MTRLPQVLHALKGTAGAVGAQRLYQLAAEMEAHARAGQMEPVLGEGPEVCREVQSCLTCAESLRAGLS